LAADGLSKCGAKISDRAASPFFGGEVFTSQRSRGDPRSICTRHFAVTKTIKNTMTPERMRKTMENILK